MKLFDLYRKTGDQTSDFLMRAPLVVVGAFLDLRVEAETRIRRETAAPGGVCSLHNSRTGLVHLVQTAVGPLGETCPR